LLGLPVRNFPERTSAEPLRAPKAPVANYIYYHGMAGRRYVVALLVSLLLLPTVACGGEEEKDEWTHGDSENWKATCDEIAGLYQDDNCREDEETIIKALADGWSKDCAIQYYTDMWDSKAEDPDPYMCEGGGAAAKPTEPPKPSIPAYELEETHYQEAQIEFVWANFACQDIKLATKFYHQRLIRNIRNASGGLLGVARFKETATGRPDMPAACLYRFSTYDLPILDEYQIELVDPQDTNAEAIQTYTATSELFHIDYPDQGITTIAWRCMDC